MSNLTNPDGMPFNYAAARLMVFALDAKGATLLIPRTVSYAAARPRWAGSRTCGR